MYCMAPDESAALMYWASCSKIFWASIAARKVRGGTSSSTLSFTILGWEIRETVNQFGEDGRLGLGGRSGGSTLFRLSCATSTPDSLGIVRDVSTGLDGRSSVSHIQCQLLSQMCLHLFYLDVLEPLQHVARSSLAGQVDFRCLTK